MEQNDKMAIIRYNKTKRQVSVVFIISSLLLVIIFLCGCKFTGKFGFVPIAPKHDGLFSELVGYSFVFVIFYASYYSVMSCFFYFEWHIINILNIYFLSCKKDEGYNEKIIAYHIKKYKEELMDVQGLNLIVLIVEYIILFFMFMFGMVHI